ncbi:hypothetical protein BaRGS_00006797 [Batillaria attramentaria]|uniref:Receptor ligand binding region domain-containing protein n=1 Tax=Batillaria attramentaria TaxID=370345 RepID=A0ABD0LR83_9CAEN
MLGMFQVPQLSYASSSAMLDDKTKYSFFSRTVPSDTLQAEAIVDILQRFNWTYVSLLYAEGSYGSEGYKAIKKRMESIGYCLAVVLELGDDFTPEQFDNVVEKLMEKKQAKVVVLFTTQYQAKGLFNAFKARNEACNFTWVGGDSISMNAHFFNEWKYIAAGTLSVNFVSQPVDRFEEHFKQMTLRSGSRNPWFRDFFASFFHCDPTQQPGTGGDACDLDLAIQNATDYKPESTASLSINAVYAMAHALHDLTKSCPQRLTDPRQCVPPTKLRDAIRQVTHRTHIMCCCT